MGKVLAHLRAQSFLFRALLASVITVLSYVFLVWWTEFWKQFFATLSSLPVEQAYQPGAIRTQIADLTALVCAGMVAFGISRLLFHEDSEDESETDSEDESETDSETGTGG